MIQKQTKEFGHTVCTDMYHYHQNLKNETKNQRFIFRPNQCFDVANNSYIIILWKIETKRNTKTK